MHNQWNSFGIETGICCKSISCGRNYNKRLIFERVSSVGREQRGKKLLRERKLDSEGRNEGRSKVESKKVVACYFKQSGQQRVERNTVALLSSSPPVLHFSISLEQRAEAKLQELLFLLSKAPLFRATFIDSGFEKLLPIVRAKAQKKNLLVETLSIRSITFASGIFSALFFERRSRLSLASRREP